VLDVKIGLKMGEKRGKEGKRGKGEKRERRGRSLIY